MLFHARALTADRKRRAARIVDTALGSNGGKEAARAVDELGKD